eukprot:gene24590-33055_t
MASTCHIYLDELLAHKELRDSENLRLCDVCKNKLGFHRRKSAVPLSVSFPKIIHSSPLVNHQVEGANINYSPSPIVAAANDANSQGLSLIPPRETASNGTVYPVKVRSLCLQPISSSVNDVNHHHHHQQQQQPSSPISSLSDLSFSDNRKRKAKTQNIVAKPVNTLWSNGHFFALHQTIDGQYLGGVSNDGKDKDGAVQEERPKAEGEGKQNKKEYEQEGGVVGGGVVDRVVNGVEDGVENVGVDGGEGKVVENGVGQRVEDRQGVNGGDGKGEGVVPDSAAFKRRRHCWKHGAKRQQLDEAVDEICRDISDHKKKKSWAEYVRHFGINKSVLKRALAKRNSQISPVAPQTEP